MKEKYLKPEVLIANIELQHIIALSKTEEPADPNEPVLSRRRRRRDDWDDEEWDEEEEEW